MDYFLGVDTGGTKSHALIAAENGQVVGFGEAGPGNHEGVGYEGVARCFQECVQKALDQAGLSISQICGAGFGVAGYDFPSEREPTLQTIGVLGLSCPVEATNDVVLGLVAGAREGWGVVVNSGTGNNVRGRDRKGREGWVTGCGGTFGEYGGAGEIVAHAIQHVSHHWSKRGQPTALSEAFVKASGAKDLPDLIEGLAQGWYDLGSRHVRLVFEVANAGDSAAIETLAWAGRELGETANAVIRQLDIQDESFDVVLIGSVFKGGKLITAPLQQTIQSFAPQISLARLNVPPAAGGVLLGMEQVGLRDAAVRKTLFDSLNR